jgi:hypothetical protein
MRKNPQEKSFFHLLFNLPEKGETKEDLEKDLPSSTASLIGVVIVGSLIFFGFC